MVKNGSTFLLTAWCVLASCQAALGQVAPVTILEIEIENFVTYYNDVSDFSKLAADASKTTLAVQPKNFAQLIGIGDIVAVNDKPAKGVLTERRTQLNRGTSSAPGLAIADAARDTIMDRYFEILNADGTPIGTIMTSGVGGGSPAPGAPTMILGADFTVTGGTGAFLGVRGQSGGTRDPRPGPRAASMAEDPAHRRMHGGGSRRFVLHLIPLSQPEVVMTSLGPAVVHASDFSLVTAGKPAKAGEILTVFAVGLGPTRPGVDPGKPFPASPRHVVNGPVEVIVDGAPAEVLYAGGYPGAVNAYQVNFRLPGGAKTGLASVQLVAAFIAGPEVRIAIQ